MNLSHPVGVTLCQIVIYSNNVYSFTRKGIKIGWKSGHKGFSFSSFHLCYSSLMKNNSAYKLNPEMSVSKCSESGFPNCGKGLWKKVVKGFAVFISFFILGCFGFQLIIRKSFHSFFIRFYFINYGNYLFNLFLAVIAKYLFQKTHLSHLKKLYVNYHQILNTVNHYFYSLSDKDHSRNKNCQT